MVYPRYYQMFGDLQTVRDSLESSYFNNQQEIEAEAQRRYNSNKLDAINYLNDYSNKKAQEMLGRWKQLAIHLIVKYNDMTIKPEKNGRFLKTKTGLGAKVKRPGFPKSFAKELVTRTGTKYLATEEN